MKNIIVIKQDINNNETWRYEAREILRIENLIMLEAYFNRNDTSILGVTIKNNDRFIEMFFSDRWYNIFEIHDRDDKTIKGWYCDICKPACISDDKITYVDLTIDLFVFPDGSSAILDKDEFNSLQIDQETREQALNSLKNLNDNFQTIVNSLPKVQG